MKIRVNIFKYMSRIMIIVFTFITLSCDKDNNNNSIQLLENISYDGNLAYKFEYDKQNRISKIHQFSGIYYNTILLTYNKAGELVSEKSESSSLFDIQFTKIGNKIDISGFKNGYIELSTVGLPILQWSPGMGLWEIMGTTYTYEYMDGNISKMTYDGSTYSYTKNYTYDDKKSPFFNCNSPEWYIVCLLFGGRDFIGLKNNRLAESFSIENENTYTYIYDDAGYPLIRIDSSGRVTTYTYVKN